MVLKMKFLRMIDIIFPFPHSFIFNLSDRYIYLSESLMRNTQNLFGEMEYYEQTAQYF